MSSIDDSVVLDPPGDDQRSGETRSLGAITGLEPSAWRRDQKGLVGQRFSAP